MLLDTVDLSQERSRWCFFYFKMLLQLLINVNRKTALQRKGMEIQIQIQIQFKPLGNAQISAVS